MKQLLTILVLVFLMSSCAKEEDQDEPVEFIGNWSWIETSGGIAGITETPESTGSSVKLEISSGSIKRYVNGDMVSELSYAIETGTSIVGGEQEMIVYEDASKQAVFLTGDQLMLVDECFDCYQYTYTKD